MGRFGQGSDCQELLSDLHLVVSCASMSRMRWHLGELTLTLVDDGEFRLDGGAMFGVVPRPLWAEHKPPDEQNRIRMKTNCVLVERGDQLLLVDTGIGDKHNAAFRERFAMAEDALRLPQQIEQAGYALSDVTQVLLTHLHFDHCGWNTREQHGRLVPTFPRARYFLARGEVEHARQPNLRDKSSYDGRNFEPLFAAGVVELFTDTVEPLPGVVAQRTPGHNADMCIVHFVGGSEQAVLWADLIPTPAHVPFAWTMGYDLYPLLTLENKSRLIPQAAALGWICIFQHETDEPLGKLVEAPNGRYQVEPYLPLPAADPLRAADGAEPLRGGSRGEGR